jgi:hypothetical protein
MQLDTQTDNLDSDFDFDFDLVVRQSPAGKNLSTETEDIVGSVTRRRLVEIYQTDNLVRAVVNCSV